MPPEGNAVCGPNLGATWTVTNPFFRANPPSADGTPSTGFFIISDSDGACGEGFPGTGQSHDVWTPEFDTSGADTVWLHVDATVQLNNNGTCIFDIDVSTDDGETWTNAFRRIAPARPVAPLPTSADSDGYFGRLDVDLSALAANQPSVRLRFRQFEPNDDWYIALDNVLVDDARPVQGGDAILLAREDFSLGIPPTWTVRSDAIPENTGNQIWRTNDPCGRSTGTVTERGANRLEALFAILDSDCDPDPAEDEWLLTPVIDCSAADEVFLHYKEEIVATSSEIQDVLVSLDGGEFFEPTSLFSYSQGALFDPGEDPFYHERVFYMREPRFPRAGLRRRGGLCNDELALASG